MKKILLIILLAVQIFALISMASALTIKNVETSEVSPGNNFRIEIEIENNLDKDAKNIEASLNLEDLPFAPKTISEEYKEEIAEDDEELFKFDLIADGSAEAGIYKIPVKVKYEVDGESKEKDFTISIVVNAEPDFILSSNSMILKNQKNEIEIIITNKGLAGAKFLEIEINEAGYSILSQNKVYIGDLDSDDFDSASFEIFTKDSGAISIPVILKYMDSNNKEYSELLFLQLKSYSREEAVKLGLIKKDNTIIYFGGVFALIVIWLVYKKIKKRKRA